MTGFFPRSSPNHFACHLKPFGPALSNKFLVRVEWSGDTFEHSRLDHIAFLTQTSLCSFFDFVRAQLLIIERRKLDSRSLQNYGSISRARIRKSMESMEYSNVASGQRRGKAYENRRWVNSYENL